MVLVEGEAVPQLPECLSVWPPVHLEGTRHCSVLGAQLPLDIFDHPSVPQQLAILRGVDNLVKLSADQDQIRERVR